MSARGPVGACWFVVVAVVAVVVAAVAVVVVVLSCLVVGVEATSSFAKVAEYPSKLTPNPFLGRKCRADSVFKGPRAQIVKKQSVLFTMDLS